jgi:hypothetical protein
MAAKKTSKGIVISDRTKKILAISSGGIVLVVGLWWAYFQFTTVPPPDLKAPDAQANVEGVVQYLGDRRGFGRLSTARQEAFLYTAYEVYGRSPDSRRRFVRAMNQMSSAEREVLNNGIFEIGRGHVMESAREYASIAPPQRSRYIDGAYSKFEQLRTGLAGENVGGGEGNLSAPLNKDLPDNSDEMMKLLADRTSARERSDAKPFIDAMAAKHKEKQGKAKKP